MLTKLHFYPVRLSLLRYSSTLKDYRCNCKCCSSTSHRACTLVCPICYSVTLTLSYSPRDGPRESNVSYSQDFGQNQDQAEGFVDSHVTNSTARCYYNPKNLTQVCGGVLCSFQADDLAGYPECLIYSMEMGGHCIVWNDSGAVFPVLYRISLLFPSTARLYPTVSWHG